MAFFSGLLFIIGLIIIFVLLLGVSLLSGLFRLFFGTKRKSSFGGGESYRSGTTSNSQGQQNQQEQSRYAKSSESHHKVFGSDEGDYVEFEEIDED